MKRIAGSRHYGIEWKKVVQYGGCSKSTDPDTEEPIATGGKRGCFRVPEPNGEAAPALFGVSNSLTLVIHSRLFIFIPRCESSLKPHLKRELRTNSWRHTLEKSLEKLSELLRGYIGADLTAARTTAGFEGRSRRPLGRYAG